MSRPATSVGEFGDKFRKAREAKSFSLDDVSNVTKIGARMLQAIEEEHFDRLPGGVFNRGFIRAYAKHLGLNADQAITDYLACLQQAQVDASQVWEPARSASPVANRPSAVANPPAPPAPPAPPKPLPAYTKPVMKTAPAAQIPAAQIPAAQGKEELPGLQLPRAEHVRPPRPKFLDRQNAPFSWRLVGVAALVIVLGTIFWMRRNHVTASSNPNPQSPSSPGAVSSPASSGPNSTQTQVSPEAAQWAAHNFGLDVPPNSSTAPKTAPIASAATPATAPPVTTNPAPAKPAATKDTSKKDTSKKDDSKTVSATHYGSDVTVRTFKPAVPPNPAPAATQPSASAAAAAKPPANTPAPMSLTVRATETSWVSITADGQSRAQETLIAPAHTSVRATQQIVVRVGNAAGVTFLFNNQEIPAQGAEGEVKTFTFDSSGIHAQ